MARMKLHCARNLPEWGTDDAENTELLYDVTAIIFGATAEQVQAGRRARNQNAPDFASLPQVARDRLDAMVTRVQASMLDVRAGVTMVGR